MRDVVPRAIASAFLAGSWRARSMTSRAAAALGERPEWLPRLARDIAAQLPRPPHDMLDVLAELVRRHPAFTREPGLHVVRWYTPPPQMARAPWPVVRLDSLGDLAAWLGLDHGVLDWLADRKGLELRAASPRLLRYRYQWVPKRSGGHRLLEAPRPRLRAVQRRLLDEILARIPPHDAAHGFVRGRSPLTHAALHVGRAVVLRCDLRAFFADVPTPRAYAVFRRAGYPEEVARTLIALCSNRTSLRALAAAPRPTSAAEVDALSQLRRRLVGPHLPQGAPTSPALANLCAHRLDVRLASLAASAGAVYSRYADDLTFSADATFAPTFVRAIDAIARGEGFALNPRKTRFMRAAQRQTVTGIVVNQRLNVTRRDHDELKAILTGIARRGAAPDELGRQRLRGRIAWIAQLNPARGAKLRTLFDAILTPATSPPPAAT